MKNSADLGRCYPPRPLASVDNTLLGVQNSSYPTKPHSIITNYSYFVISVSWNKHDFDLDLNFSYAICRFRLQLLLYFSHVCYTINSPT